ncbi:MAG: pirin [Candidatus Dormibacteraeota bacterium]|nr:pirin [Candidatus Dormibacteraeota bacterium]
MTPPDVGLPYGSMPRVVLAWMTTEAVRTRNRELHLGHSLQEFLDKLGLNRGGGPRGDITRLRNQMTRLLSCAINVRYSDPTRDGLRNALIAEEADLWWDPRRPHERVLWGSTIVLYEKFFNEVVTHPVPVDLAVLRQLRRSPLALDVYSWLTWRMSFLRKRTAIPWEHLEDQFGANYGRSVDFRKAFRKALAEVLRHYSPGVESLPGGISLRPSAPSIARTRLR